MTMNNGGKKESTRDKAKVRELDEDVGAGGSKYMFGLRTDYEINEMRDGQCMDIKIGGVTLDLLIDSGAQCNIIDEQTWKQCKNRGIVYEFISKFVDKRKYPYGHDKALALLG